MFFFSLLIIENWKLECSLPTLIADGYCQDNANNLQCGDCCGSCVNKEYCTECECKNGVDLGIRNALVGDGFCHDSTNNAGCNFDGGDCCGSCVNMKYCAECKCAGQHIGEAKDNAFIANGYCEDENNNPSCNYDGFDCCRLYVVKEYCTDCTCKGIYTLMQKYTQFGLFTM